MESTKIVFENTLITIDLDLFYYKALVLIPKESLLKTIPKCNLPVCNDHLFGIKITIRTTIFY